MRARICGTSAQPSAACASAAPNRAPTAARAAEGRSASAPAAAVAALTKSRRDWLDMIAGWLRGRREHAIDFVGRHAVEIAGNGQLEGTRGGRELERATRRIAGAQRVQQSRHEAVAAADAIDDVDVVAAAAVEVTGR